MGWSFTRASSHSLSVATTPVTAAPLTISAWVKPTTVSTGSGRSVVTIADSGSEDNYFDLVQYDGDMAVDVRSTSAFGEAWPASGLSTSAWRHIAAVTSSTTSRIAYCNGGASPTDTTSVTPASIDRIGVGYLARLSAAQYFDGLIAEVAIWNAGLSGTDITALAAGDSPMSLATTPVRYWRLKENGDLTDIVASSTLTATGATWTSDHPTVDDPPAAPAGAARRRRTLMGAGR